MLDGMFLLRLMPTVFRSDVGGLATSKIYSLIYSNSCFYFNKAFDGITARKLNQTSTFGAWVSPINRLCESTIPCC